MARFSCSSFLVLAALLLGIELAIAATPIDVPGTVQRTWTTGQGPFAFSDSRSWDSVVSTQSGKAKLPVVARRGFTAARVAGFAKTLLKNNPAKIAVTGVGVYLISQIPDAQWIDGKPVIGKAPVYLKDGNQYSRWKPRNRATYFADPVGACSSLGADFTLRAEYQVWNNSWAYVVCHNGRGIETQIDNVKCTAPASFNPSTGQCDASYQPSVSYTPFTDANYDAATSSASFTPSHWNDLGPLIDSNIPGSFDYPDGHDLTGPAKYDFPGTTTTSTNPTTGDTTVTESLPSIRFDYKANPYSVTSTPSTTTNTYTNGSLTNTSTTVVTTPAATAPVTPPPQLEIPTDCDFMPTVCKFIDWVKEPFNEEDPDLTEFMKDDDFTKSVTFTGNNSCPAPTVISTQFGEQVFDWQPGCDWAAMLKPLIILGALLCSLYITLGIGRSD